MRIISVVVAVFTGLLLLAACGGGGGGGSTNTTINGVASKGIIRNGTIKIFALNADGSKGELLKETTTDGNGAYRADLGQYRGAILVEASGSYTDEATGTTKTIPAGSPLRAALDSASGETAVAVTPLTELAVQRSEDPSTHRINVPAIASSNAEIASLFKVDILRTNPVDPLASNPTATQEQKECAVVLAAFSNLMYTKGKDLSSVIGEIRDSIGAGNSMAVPVAVQFQAALADFVANPANRTGITDVTMTPLINIGSSSRSLAISVAGASGLISGVKLTVILPPGVTAKADTTGGLSGAVLRTSGGASGNALVAGQYTPSTGSMRGRVDIAVISATGFAPGEFLALQCDVAPDATPLDADFILSVEEALDNQNNPLRGLSLTAVLNP